MASFQVRDPSAIPSPALVFSLETIRNNLDRMLAIAGSPARLRPHMKTHKTLEITELYLSQGITKHKCATLREAEILAESGATDVLIAYPMIGPNQRLICRLAQRFPVTKFSVLGDDLTIIEQLQIIAEAQEVGLGLFIDVNVGQNRSGVGEKETIDFCDQMAMRFGKKEKTTGLKLIGLHLYDGHNTALAVAERADQVKVTLQQGLSLRKQLQPKLSTSLEIVVGGTPAFLAYAHVIDDSSVSLSPGTCILHDAGYEQKYPELGFQPAAAVLTRCISRPGSRLVTFDVGTKAICSDPPAGQRCVLVGLENARAVLHNEEHLVMETDQADNWQPGRVTYAIPMHVCPTVALHEQAYVISGGEIRGCWKIAARSRLLG